MKIFFLILCVCVFFSSSAQFTVGLYGGFDQSKFSGDLPSDYTYEFKDGFVVGLTIDIPLNEMMDLSVRPNFTQNGANVSAPASSDVIGQVPNYPDDTTFLFPVTNNYLALPVLFQVYVTPVFYANCGIETAYNLSSEVNIYDKKTDVSSKMNAFLFNAVFGFGVKFPIKISSINIEFSYAQGLNTMTIKEDIEEGTSPRLRTTRFRLATYITVFSSKKSNEN